MHAVVAQVPVEGRRERKKRELRSRIYRQAQGLFLTQGFEATTVEQIAAAADIAPATFFNHFQSKHALLGEMTTEVFDHLQELIAQYLLRPGSAQDRLASFAERAARDASAARGVARDLVFELMRTRGRPGETPPYLERIFAPIAKTLRAGQRNGEVRTDLDADFLAEMVLGALNAPFLNWMNDPDYPLEQRLRQAAVFIGEAIRPMTARPRRAAR
ncbi:MAG: TetR/AcrR family transcriptional regulator [Deltaproteobacteria bacterium]|nr:TetR/AcrR family transcriptional regulator [Deltaproteobacteria bacterium]